MNCERRGSQSLVTFTLIEGRRHTFKHNSLIVSSPATKTFLTAKKQAILTLSAAEDQRSSSSYSKYVRFYQPLRLVISDITPLLTFKYALTCLFPSITQGNIFVLSVTTVYNKLSAAPSTSSFPVGADGSDLIRYMIVVKWERANRGRVGWAFGGGCVLLSTKFR